MMKRIFTVVLALFLFTSIGVEAKGAADYFILSGEDMLPMAFDLDLDVGLIFDPQARITPDPEIASEPYLLRSYVYIEHEMTEFMLSPVLYYPDERVLYFVGARDRGIYQEFDKRWYPVNSEVADQIDAYLARGRQMRTQLSDLLNWQG